MRRLYQLRNREAFRKDVISLLPKIIPCETCSYNEVDLIRGYNEWITYPEKIGFAGDHRVFNQHIHEHPPIRYYSKTGQSRTRKISDLLSQRQFRMLGIYNEYYRRLGIAHQMTMPLVLLGKPRLHASGFAFNRSVRDFSERDRLCLNLLRPHLVQTYHHAEALSRYEQERTLMARGIEELARGLIVLGAQRRVNYMSVCARRWLTELFGEASLRNRQLPEHLDRWIREQEALSTSDGLYRVRKPLLIGQGEQRLFVRLLSDSGQSLLVLENEPKDPSPSDFEHFGLTPREAEVLAWVCQGKSNADIAAILSLSVRTVEKHVEHILEKLGVETRTAAVVLADRFAAGVTSSRG